MPWSKCSKSIFHTPDKCAIRNLMDYIALPQDATNSLKTFEDRNWSPRKNCF